MYLFESRTTDEKTTVLDFDLALENVEKITDNIKSSRSVFGALVNKTLRLLQKMKVSKKLLQNI